MSDEADQAEYMDVKAREVKANRLPKSVFASMGRKGRRFWRAESHLGTIWVCIEEAWPGRMYGWWERERASGTFVLSGTVEEAVKAALQRAIGKGKTVARFGLVS